MGRKKEFSEDMRARFPKGTFDRIGKVLREGEDRTEFVRTAVEIVIRRRERKKKEAEKAGTPPDFSDEDKA
jgi:hypothetical protein